MCDKFNWEGQSLGYYGWIWFKDLIPMLVMVFKCLNPSLKNTSSINTCGNEFLFGAFASDEKVNESLLKFELSLFWQVVILKDDLKNLLAWWKKHECQYPNVGFLARQILGILGSQIETKCIFSIVGVLPNLRCYRLGFDNLDALVMICKNWLNDACMGCPLTFPKVYVCGNAKFISKCVYCFWLHIVVHIFHIPCTYLILSMSMT
jgi:hypothetical protein